jgi:hypothetical protein
MLTRAKACYEKFLAQYSRQDAESLAARKAVEDIAKELDKPAAPAAQPAAATVWTTITNCIANKLVADSDAAGRDFGEPYRDQSPQGYLIGFRLTLKPFIKNKYVASVQPIFMTRGSVEQVGAVHGKPTGDLVVIKAKLGYAVSALTTQSGLNMDFFQPTFAKIKGATLDPSDTYAGDAIGAARGGKKDAGSSGNLIIGIFGKADDRIESIGLTFLTPK